MDVLSDKAEGYLLRAAYALKDPAEYTLEFLEDLESSDTSSWTEEQREQLKRAIAFAETMIGLVDGVIGWEDKGMH